MSDEWSESERLVFEACQDAQRFDETISLNIAMAIASWWHSPVSPNSTRLSTMGIVTCDMRMSDFATEDEYKAADKWNRLALESLGQFIRDSQNNGEYDHYIGCEHDEW